MKSPRGDKIVTLSRRYNSDPGVPELFVHHHNHDGHRESAQRWHMPKDESIEEAMKSRKNHCTSHALERSHRLEYKALAKEKFDKEGLRPFPHALYLTVSSFQNNGLVLTQSSVMDYVDSPVLLSTVGACRPQLMTYAKRSFPAAETLILLGNTGLPIMVRYIAFTWSRRIQPQSEHKRVLDFLLEHPRRCFTHMFPAVHTLWLLLVVVALNIVGTVVLLVQDWDSKAFTGLEAGGKIGNALFQTVSTRTAGMNSINIAQLSQGTTFFMAVMMYFSTTPTVVTMRLSAAEHELDITGRVEGVEEAVITAENSLKGQARRYLTQDATYLLVICFLICCLEQDSFARAAKHPSPDSDGIYTDFGFFKVLFEILSAYGTCGLSLGFENQTFSFSGVWCGASQMLLVFTMILGRLRGLPDSIDASVRMAMPSTEATAELTLRASASQRCAPIVQRFVRPPQVPCDRSSVTQAELPKMTSVARPRSRGVSVRCSMAKGKTSNTSNTSWDVCDRILADAGEAEKPQPMTGEQLLFSEDGAMLQVSPIRLGMGSLEQILGLRPGEICEVYGGPGAGKTQLGLTVAACAAAAHPVLFVTAKDHPSALAERLHTILLARKMNETALDRLRIYQAMDFADFAKIILSFGDTLTSQQNSTPLVLVLGASGQLGRRVSEHFLENNWHTIGAVSWMIGKLFQSIPGQLPHLAHLDAVVNLAGGFAMGTAEDPAVLANTMTMVESSVYTSIVASYVSSQMLRTGGLLILPGAAAAWSPTAWSLPYGTAKVAVHHLVRSLAESDSLPSGTKTIGLAPQILDTVQNRQAMPDADVSTWASLDEVAEQIESWCADPSPVQNGHVYFIDKKSGSKATFEARKPLVSCTILCGRAVVVDGLSSLLSPFTSASSWAHRWRLTWAWRALRQLAMPRGATMCGSCVLILSHTVNEGTLALGQQWSPAASRRLELSPGHLELQMAKRGIPVANGASQVATAVDLVISDAPCQAMIEGLGCVLRREVTDMDRIKALIRAE
eukprot:s884_g4.t2